MMTMVLWGMQGVVRFVPLLQGMESRVQLEL